MGFWEVIQGITGVMWLIRWNTYIFLQYHCAYLPKSDLYCYIIKYVCLYTHDAHGVNTLDTVSIIISTITIIRLIRISDYYGHMKRLSDAAQTQTGLAELSHYMFILKWYFLISVEDVILFRSLCVTTIKM